MHLSMKLAELIRAVVDPGYIQGVSKKSEQL